MSPMAPLRDMLLSGYDGSFDIDGFSGARLAGRLSTISEIGLTAQRGSRRIGFSPEEKQAKDLVLEWMMSLGLAVRTDAAGNCFGRLNGANNALPAVLCGSHVDTVPNGGHFDGVLGVVLALEAVEMWKAVGFVPRRPYEIAVFSDEEGTRFNAGFVGSSALAGALSEEELLGLSDAEGNSFSSVVEQAGLSLSRFREARRDLSAYAAFVEVHIEQGLVLERHSLPIGIVSGICGLVGLQMTVQGLAGHAGATPMRDRKDALVTASRILSAIADLPAQFSETAVATVGQMDVFPNSPNVIAGKVRFSVDIRDIQAPALDRLATRIVEVAAAIAAKDDLGFSWSKTLSLAPAAVGEELRQMQIETLRDLGLAPFQLPSGAGHDAMLLAPHLPMAMFFVRSKDGISHNPREYSSLGDCAIAARALSRFLQRLLSMPTHS